MLSIEIKTAGLSKEIEKLRAALDPAQLLPALEVKAKSAVVDHLIALPSNKLGGTPTGYWNQAARNTDSQIKDSNTVRLTIRQRGFALHFVGGTVKPKGISEVTGKPVMRLSLPAIPAAHGLSPIEVPGLKIGKFAEGFGLGKDGHRWFILARQTKHTANKGVLPDLAAIVKSWLTERIHAVGS